MKIEMSNPFKKLFGGKVENLDPHIDSDIIGDENFEIKTSKDLESFYNELELPEWDEELEDDKYWQGLDDRDPKNKSNGNVLYQDDMENIADEENYYTSGLDDADLSFIIGKKGWVEPNEVDDSPAPVLENENPHTPREKLSQRDLERQERMDARSKKHTRIIERINHKDSITLSVLDTNNVEISGGIAQLLSFKGIYTISNKHI